MAELLGAGVPVAPDAHVGIGGDDEGGDAYSKEFMVASRALAALTRQRGVLAVHVDAAVDLGLVRPESAAPVKAFAAARLSGMTCEQALASAVRASAPSPVSSGGWLVGTLGCRARHGVAGRHFCRSSCELLF